MGNISLRNILFSVLAKYRLIGRVWTSQFIQDHPLDLASRTFALGWYGGAWVLLGAHHSFGLGEWDIGLISLSLSTNIINVSHHHKNSKFYNKINS